MGSGTHRDRLVVATNNLGKLKELRALLIGLPLDVYSVAEVLGAPLRVVEDGATLAENAQKKARAASRATMMLALADDSGLEVDALDGLPGVRSARFAHDGATDDENNAALLSALDDGAHATPAEAGCGEGLRARFRCVLSLVDPLREAGGPRLVEGVCQGVITRTPRGAGGFGYDSLFIVAGMGKTMAELSTEEKNRISHRAHAFAALRPVLEESLRERASQIARLTRTH